MVTLLRLAACSVPLLIGLTSRCFAHRARASCAPYQFPLKSYGFSGAETTREGFCSGKWDFPTRRIASPCPLNSAWSFTPSHRPALTLARCSAPADFASLRPRGSAFAASDARKLACGSPCFIGLTTACFAHCARFSCAPPYTPPGTIEVRKGFAPLFVFSTV